MKMRGKEVDSDAEESCIVVDDGDIVVMGSDGLWDNLFIKEIKNLVNEN